MPNQKPFSVVSFTRDFLMGGTAAAISKTAAAPIERVKLLMQNQGAMLAAGRLDTPYAGISDCFRRIYASEGVASLWRGNGTNVIRYFPTQAFNFAFKDRYKRLFGYRKSEGFGLWVFGNVASGAAAGATSSVFVYSLDYARTRLSTDIQSSKPGGGRQYSGLLDVYRQTLRSDGLVGLYRGFWVNLAGIVVYRGIEFGSYDTLKESLPAQFRGHFAASFAVAWVCTTAGAVISYPFDTVRRRMMMTSGSGVHYTGFVQAWRDIVATEGTKALFSGCGANIMRCVAGAMVLSLYDKFQELALGRVYAHGSG